ncbi:TATA element modulatory factor [Tribolium castaneum]|uniref:TATA element modulatory factor-like Protein n=1 Tax=Tribolium castaneum TaxID=7070 RepID=D6WF84_TRICA|nr:PREDICTED: TATA element modulatory factor [Tribolium castaneum]XP_969463.1 PREDICTED: TATA element modulatory factor [Tribolium castaneum]EFA00297.1 TATA element modulatory factor-like Protein [Tribolium castaneum]|eukprot:XP_008190658.1 PREDICTED: TATA element modulatory factor [Tribolium castaneum]
MSWFDASGFASIAKSALREAQRTIDKALDIKEDEVNVVPTNTPIDTNSDDFFGTWGISQSGHIKEGKKDEEGPKMAKLQSSLWGSFTGSFFDASKEYPKTPSIDSLDDSVDIGSEHFSRSKLVVQQSDDGESHYSRLSSMETDEGTLVNDNEGKLVEIQLDSPDGPSNSDQAVVVKRPEKTQSSIINRLSAISNESGKNSSESVELITCSTECTTSPESELLSGEHSISTSSSAVAKQTSESVEIIADSLTSPSSVEIIGSDSIDCKNQDEFASPMESPIAEEEASPCAEKNTPDSVEVIPEDQEESVAEDTMSYTSISESTSATVLDQAFLHLKPQKMLKDTYNTSMPESDIPLSPEKNHTFADAITRAPSRSGMHLPLTQVNQVLIDTQPQSSRQDLSNLLKNTNIIDIPQEDNVEGQIESCDEGSQSDRTVIAKDGGMDSSSDTSVTENSVYLKNLIADAMTEKSPEVPDCATKTSHFMDLTQSMIDSSQGNVVLENISISQLDMPPRENSPVSSESRSDLVKIGSSGHTSGDELETTTSSDIEIISSPNGDSSSTQSRQSPAKQTCTKNKSDGTKVDLLCKMTMKKAKGHTRELSETSSVSDDSHSSEVDRLIKRIAEMTEILESRESKLIDINRRNAELQELNTNLRHQLDSMLTKQLETADLSQVTEEYTQRLSALEKKFQQAIREKDTLRKQLEQSKQEAATRLSKSDLDSLISEKDEIIKELREEGEKLSKQQLQHSNIIKKLRAKEKENESTIKHLKETIEDLSSEADRLKRSLTAKEEVERSQIEAVHQLTAKNKKLETEVDKFRSQLDDLTQKYDTVKKSLDAAKKELVDKNKTSSELIAREHKLESLENEKKQTESQNAAILNELEELRSKMRQLDLDYAKKEQSLRKENNDLLRRLEDAEARNEELSQSVLEVSKPLVRQLESLQATHTMKIASFERIEQEMTLKINELQTRLQTSLNSERTVKDESVTLKTRLSDLESELSSLKHQNELLRVEVEQNKTEKQISEQELGREINELKEQLVSERHKVAELAQNASSLQEQLEKSASESERKKSTEDAPNLGRNSPRTASNSPTLSLGKISVAESLGSSFWSQDEPFDGGQPPRYTNMFEMQMLQTNLKQRDGELQQLQWELNRREQERALLNKEISSLLTRVEELETKVQEYDVLKGQHSELQQQYDTLCQLFGEKVEENEELKLDLQDVKEMYKSQIDELLKQQKQNL